MMKTISKFGFFIFLLFCVGFAFAADANAGASASGVAGAAAGSSGIAVAPDDFSIHYLGAIFGQVGSVLPSAEGNLVLGAMFKQFNYGISVLAILIFAYIYGKGIIDTASEGQFLGKKANSVWVPLRGVLGMCLLIPSSGTGYNIIQVFAMWVVVQGIGIADQVWNVALTFKTDTVVQTTQAAGGVTQAAYKVKYQQTVEQIFQSLVCVYAAQETTSVKGASIDVGFGPYGGQNTDKTTQYHFQYGNYKCGLLDWSSIVDQPSGTSTPNANYNNADKDNEGRELKQLYASMINNIVGTFQPIAQYYVTHSVRMAPESLTSIWPASEVQKINPSKYPKVYQAYPDAAKATGTASSGAITTDQVGWDIYNFAGSNFIYDATQMYINQLTNYKAEDLEATTQDFTSKGEQGWAMAGAYYYNLKGATSSASIPSDVPVMDLNSYNVGSTVQKIMDNAGKYADSIAGLTTGATGDDTKLGTLIATYGGTATAALLAATAVSAYYSGLAAAVFFPLGVALFVVVAAFTAVLSAIAFGGDPIALLQMLGTVLLATAGATWVGMLGAIYWGSLGNNIMRCMSPLGPSFNAAASYISTAGILLVATLVSFGATLAIYLPMLPYIYFVLATIHWLLIVVELMIIVVIGVLGAMMPEGQHELWGMSQQTVFLLMNAFLRPVMMVFGLIAATFISTVAIKLINAGFFSALQGAAYGGGALANPIEAILFLVIYASLCITAVTTPLKLITRIPDVCMQGIQFVAHSSQAIEQDVGMLQRRHEAGAKGMGGGMQSGGRFMGSEAAKQEKEGAREQSTGGETKPGG